MTDAPYPAYAALPPAPENPETVLQVYQRVLLRQLGVAYEMDKRRTDWDEPYAGWRFIPTHTRTLLFTLPTDLCESLVLANGHVYARLTEAGKAVAKYA